MRDNGLMKGNNKMEKNAPSQAAGGNSVRGQAGIALASVPRPVPALLRVHLHVLYSLPAVFFLGFGLIAFLCFGLDSDWKAAAFLLPTASARGTVTGQYPAKGTHSSGSHGGGIAIDAITYTFAGPGGTLYRGVSYTSADDNYQLDTSAAPDSDSPVGLPVSVQYVKGHPALSRIRHLRTGVFNASMLAMVIWPITGLFLLRGSLRLARRTCLLLAQGRQDPSTGNLYPPPGQEQPKDPADGFELTSVMTGPPLVAGGQLYPPAMGRVLLVFGLLAVILLGDVALLQRGISQLGY